MEYRVAMVFNVGESIVLIYPISPSPAPLDSQQQLPMIEGFTAKLSQLRTGCPVFTTHFGAGATGEIQITMPQGRTGERCGSRMTEYGRRFGSDTLHEGKEADIESMVLRCLPFATRTVQPIPTLGLCGMESRNASIPGEFPKTSNKYR